MEENVHVTILIYFTIAKLYVRMLKIILEILDLKLRYLNFFFRFRGFNDLIREKLTRF